MYSTKFDYQRELNACGCLVSDYGIRKLCASVDGDQKLGQCKSIRKLKINGKNVSEQGIEVALDNLPYLEEIDYPYLAQLLTRRLELEYFDTVLPQYSLTQLVYRYDHYFPCPSSAFSLAICMCPSIDEVHIELNPQDELTDADLLSKCGSKFLFLYKDIASQVICLNSLSCRFIGPKNTSETLDFDQMGSKQYYHIYWGCGSST